MNHKDTIHLHVQEKFVETISAVQFSNGIVRMFFVGKPLEQLANSD